jgi:hypothetical protein
MRRGVVFLLSLLALALPAGALARGDAPTDGTLVVQDGSAPASVPVVALKVTGAVLGRIGEGGKLIVADQSPNSGTPPVVAGFASHRVLDSGAEVCTAADNSCLMHIGGALRRQRAGVRAMHLAEILAAQE